MTRREIRTGIAQFFGGAALDPQSQIYRPTPLADVGLAGVRPYWTTRFEDRDYTATLADGRNMGAVMCVHLAGDSERRIGLGGPTGGIKERPLAVELWVFHLARTAVIEDAQADLDDLLEAITARIHGDRTLGGACIQAGESQRGISRDTASVPAYEPGALPTVRQEARISFDATVYPQA